MLVLSDFSRVHIFRNPMDCSPPDSSPLCPWDFPSKNTGVGCPALLQRIKPTSPALQADFLPLSHQGSPLESYM